MEQLSLLVVSYDGLGVGALGPYGNTWVATPVWNELAARGRIYDFVFAHGDRLADAACSWWSGLHPVGSAKPDCWLPSAAAGRQTVLLSDDAEMLQTAVNSGWSHPHQLMEMAEPTTAATLDATAVVRQSHAAGLELAQLQAPFFAWVHLSALRSPWDVPAEFRAKLADEEDLTIPTFVEVPDTPLAVDDHDAIWAHQLAYAAQMTAVDASLALFVDWVDELRATTPVALIVTAPRGFALGAHGSVGISDGQLRTESLHVPLIVDVPRDPLAGQRVDAMVPGTGLYDLMHSLLDGTSWSPPPHRGSLAVSPTHRAWRTSAWFLRETIGSGDVELFAKPDDRWDANEISSRCPEIVSQLQTEMSDFMTASQSAG